MATNNKVIFNTGEIATGSVPNDSVPQATTSSPSVDLERMMVTVWT